MWVFLLVLFLVVVYGGCCMCILFCKDIIIYILFWFCGIVEGVRIGVILLICLFGCCSVICILWCVLYKSNIWCF